VRPAFSYLDQHDVAAVAVAEITLRDVEAVGRMLGDDLKLVVRRHVERLAHRLIDDLAEFLAVALRLALQEIDAHERHGLPPFGGSPVGDSIASSPH